MQRSSWEQRASGNKEDMKKSSKTYANARIKSLRLCSAICRPRAVYIGDRFLLFFHTNTSFCCVIFIIIVMMCIVFKCGVICYSIDIKIKLYIKGTVDYSYEWYAQLQLLFWFRLRFLWYRLCLLAVLKVFIRYVTDTDRLEYEKSLESYCSKQTKMRGLFYTLRFAQTNEKRKQI